MGSDDKFVKVAIAGFLVIGTLLIAAAFIMRTKPESLQAFTDKQVAPEGVHFEAQPFPEQTKEQREKAIRFADEVYVKEYGGPFGSGRERMVPIGQKIKSSAGYGFRPPPPPVSVFTNKYDQYPEVPTSNGVVYREILGSTCTAEHMSSSMSMILDTCDALCSHDNQCLAYSYDFSNGNCLTYATCDDLRTASANSKVFVKSKVTHQL